MATCHKRRHDLRVLDNLSAELGTLLRCTTGCSNPYFRAIPILGVMFFFRCLFSGYPDPWRYVGCPNPCCLVTPICGVVLFVPILAFGPPRPLEFCCFFKSLFRGFLILGVMLFVQTLVFRLLRSSDLCCLFKPSFLLGCPYPWSSVVCSSPCFRATPILGVMVIAQILNFGLPRSLELCGLFKSLLSGFVDAWSSVLGVMLFEQCFVFGLCRCLDSCSLFKSLLSGCPDP